MMIFKNVFFGCFLSVFLTVFTAFAAAGQPERMWVWGIVVDEAGEPMPGAIVLVKGTIDRGAITDTVGRYTLNASVGETLEFRFLGCYTEERVVSGEGDRVDVALRWQETDIDSDPIPSGVTGKNRQRYFLRNH
jgi:hypothetical protein